MKEKKSKIMINKLGYIFLLIIMIGCNSKEEFKTKWAESICYPYTYDIGKGEIDFFSNSNNNLNFPTVMGNNNWSVTGQVRWHENTDLPDSIFVSYEALNNKLETFLYKGGIKLPKNEIIKLFKGEYGSFPQYINCGLAPGGRVCIFIDEKELLRFKVKEIKKISNKPLLIGDSIAKTENLNYLKHHPVDYSNWDKPDIRYKIDFGYTSENNKSYEFYGVSISREGIRNTFDEYYLDNNLWGIPSNIEVDYRGVFYSQIKDFNEPIGIQLPVHLQLGWKVEGNKSYYTEVVLPKNFHQRFIKSYIDPKTKKEVNFNRLVFGIENDGEHCIIWMEGPNKLEKLMRFKGQLDERNGDDEFILYGKYAQEVIYY